MSGVREVVTLQLGHYASSVGAHWWGLQEALFLSNSTASDLDEVIQHEVLFRTGRTLQGRETFTPRLILMDLKESLAALKQEGYLYEDPKNNIPVAWKGNLTTHQQDPVPPSPFLEGLDQREGERFSNGDFASKTLPAGKGKPQQLTKPLASERPAPAWSDFLRTNFHPRSILTIHEYNREEESSRLEAFGQGEKLLQDGRYLEELEDRLHFYVEECDYLQGFQLLCDLHNGFSGLGSKAAELLQDEYAGKGILACGLTPVLQSNLPHRNFYRLMNTALGIVRLASHSSLFCPLSLNGNLGLKLDGPVALPYVHYEPSLDYHTSAILATALDTLTIPYRLQASDISMASLTESLNFSGRKVAEASAALPFPVAKDQSLPDALYSQQPSTAWCPLSSCGNRGDAGCFAQSVVLRGISKRQQVSNAPPGTEPKSILHMCETGQEVLAHYLHNVSPQTLSTSLLLQGPCKLLAPYPQFFSPFLNKHGLLSEKPSRSPAKVESLPILAAFQSSAGLYQTLGDVYRELHGTDLRRWASFFSAGMEADDFQEALDELRTLSLCYKKGSLDENSDSDDTD
ncbi:protein misato homolog 1 [Protobothrops mucrosquamatus]|uniref:protein misato homolog 1 n=1 Tax=Protobothrops mucrosquamatus TaxID=103944 RepID=UPI0007757833|nr:protein misato homolog 1 [Protobothrops mucrosquamatus]